MPTLPVRLRQSVGIGDGRNGVWACWPAGAAEAVAAGCVGACGGGRGGVRLVGERVAGVGGRGSAGRRGRRQRWRKRRWRRRRWRDGQRWRGGYGIGHSLCAEQRHRRFRRDGRRRVRQQADLHHRRRRREQRRHRPARAGARQRRRLRDRGRRGANHAAGRFGGKQRWRAAGVPDHVGAGGGGGRRHQRGLPGGGTGLRHRCRRHRRATDPVHGQGGSPWQCRRRRPRPLGRLGRQRLRAHQRLSRRGGRRQRRLREGRRGQLRPLRRFRRQRQLRHAALRERALRRFQRGPGEPAERHRLPSRGRRDDGGIRPSPQQLGRRRGVLRRHRERQVRRPHRQCRRFLGLDRRLDRSHPVPLHRADRRRGQRHRSGQPRRR